MIQVRKNKYQVKKVSSETTTKAEKKVKKTLPPKKAPKSPEFVDTDSDD